MSKQTLNGKANIGLIIGLVVIVIIGLVVFNQSNSGTSLTGEQSSERQTAENQSQTTAGELAAEDQTDEMVKPLEEKMDKTPTDGSGMAEEGGPEAGAGTKSGTYTDYKPDLLANSGDDTVLLFFHASWCPSCRALEKNVEANLSNIPADVTILVVNYDTETDLKKKYGVTRQHTLVQVDANGNKIKTLTGLTNTLDQVLAQL